MGSTALPEINHTLNLSFFTIFFFMAAYVFSDRRDTQQRYTYSVNLEAKPLGVGGMGKVLKGTRTDNATGQTRQVAVKFLFDDQPAGVIDRARREAHIEIKNENLVEMLGFVETEEITPNGRVIHYQVVSELLRGVMLLDLVRGRITDADGVEIPFAHQMYNLYCEDKTKFAVSIVKNVLRGMMSLHAEGYIHRDIDPSNIMITDDGRVKIIDFGIAKKITNLSKTDLQLTSVGQFMGKAAYAAPELVSGDLANQNQTTDLYALGLILYVLEVGTLPFTGSLAEIMKQQITVAVPVRNVADKRLRRIVKKATEKKQSKRYQSAAEFLVDLEKLSAPKHPKVNQEVLKVEIVLAGAAILGLLIGIIL